jgi:acyl carrier protein
MTEQQVLEQINELLAGLMNAKGSPVPRVVADTELLGGEIDIDSLDLATLVRELEESIGFDPFADGFIEFRTAGELAKLYVRG